VKRALLALPLLLLVASSAASAAETRVELFHNRLFIPATVNGTRATALLDSGAEMTILDAPFAAKLGVRLGSDQVVNGSGGSDKGRFAHGLRIATAGVRLPVTTAVVLDLTELSQRLLGRPVSVILGRELFDAARLRIDLGRGTLAAVPRTREPRGIRCPLKTEHGVETFPAAVEGHAPVQAEFDLGNGTEVLVGKAYAEKIGLSAPDRIVGRSEGGGIGGKRSRDIVILKSLVVGGRTFENVRAAIDATPTAADLNVGTSILRHFRITTDFPQHALWLEPTP
jgi:predicted aspartyl protease